MPSGALRNLVDAPRPSLAARRLRSLRRALLAWYATEHRDLPWRRSRDPWGVLVSEVMLQQTQATRVSERYARFMARFPTPAALASAAPAAVLEAWSGLGYNRRALALRRTAAHVTALGWPTTVAGMQELPGVGPYTARAVAALAFGAPVGVVDTNVRRWLLRRLRVDNRPPDLQAAADALAGEARTADDATAWAHASMEFGACICRARAPRCDSCPIARGCPSRGSPPAVPAPRQSAFVGSTRARRGALVRALVGAQGSEISLREARRLAGANLSGGAFERLVEGLASDGLAHRSADRLRLGAAEEVADTIGQ